MTIFKTGLYYRSRPLMMMIIMGFESCTPICVLCISHFCLKISNYPLPTLTSFSMFKLLMQWLFLLPGFHLLHGNLTTSSSRVMLPKKVLPHLLPLRVAIKGNNTI